jgi:hypothetical protein
MPAMEALWSNVRSGKLFTAVIQDWGWHGNPARASVASPPLRVYRLRLWKEVILHA